MSGSEVIKQHLRDTFSNSKMPDFEAEMKSEPSKLVVEKLNSHQQAKFPICTSDCTHCPHRERDIRGENCLSKEKCQHKL
jgi:hypothetical protein